MTRQIILALAIGATLAGCGRISESRFNPLNWFGRSEASEPVVSPEVARRANLVTQVIALRVEQVPGGAILRATGLPPRQGFYDGQLVPVGDEVAVDGALNYEFAISSPGVETRVSTQQSREVLVGRFLSTQTLEGVRVIRVSGATNALVVRR